MPLFMKAGSIKGSVKTEKHKDWITVDSCKVTITADLKELSSESADRTVELIYGECLLRMDDQGGYLVPVKGVRDDWADGDVHGYRDTVVLPGGQFSYEPFHWRTFWFLKLVISEGETPLVVRDASYRFTTYPQTLRSSFISDIPDTERLWRTSWRTCN